jgi:hypothetical protein
VLPGHNHQGFAEIMARLAQELGTFEAPRPALPQALPAEELNAGDAARLEELATNMANRTGEGSLMFELKREVLFTELLTQMQSGAVLIAGAPGIRKSWLIGRLLGHLKQTGRFVLPLIAEEYEVATLDELQLSLGLSVRVEALLSKRKGAVLLIDGLDALRAENSQRVFRDLIVSVLQSAPSVIVVASIRSFDLAESPIFSSLTSFLPGLGKPFSSLTVGALGDEEIEFVRRERSEFDEL